MDTRNQIPRVWDGASRPAFAPRPRHGALCAFAVTLLAYTPTMAFFDGAPEYGTLADTFLFFFLVGTLAAGVAVAARALQGASQSTAPRWADGAAVAVYLAATLGFVALLLAPQPLPAGAAATGLAAGLTLPRLVCAWGRAVAAPLDRALLLCAFVACVASFGGWVLALLPLHLLVPLFGLIAVAGSVPLLFLKTGECGASPDPESVVATPIADRGPDGDEGAAGKLGRLASVTWLPLLGLAVYAFMTDVMTHSAFGVVQASYLGGIVAALIVAAACLRWARRPLLPWCYRVLVPAMGAVLVVLGAFPAATFPQEMSVVALYVFYIVLAMLGCALCLAVVHGRELAANLVCGFAVSMVAAGALLGQILSSVLMVTDDFAPWLSMLTGLFVAVLLLFLGHAAWIELATPYHDGAPLAAGARIAASDPAGAPGADGAPGSSPASASAAAATPEAPAPAAHSVRDTLEARCASVAAEAALSPREAEVLVYLARGFTPAYIAKSLVLSISTVRTHVRNIYRKLGINKREELLHLIDGE